ncbi:cytochrome P450 4C1 [Microplitis demolitor]|uniref:cytochrome P450 4C1 n=1 Tax=Microplitis demolitor TaxID=69319 RepID=UPI0004CD45D4|nr:cytochrome P450 4C1 [Microplitis demolitor]
MDTALLITSILLTVFLILVALHSYIHGNRKGYYCDKIPGPTWYPILGNVLDLAVSPENFWNFHRRLAKDFYPVYKYWLGTWPVVHIYHPDDLKVLFASSKNTEKSLFYDFLRPWLQNGLVTSEGNKWRGRRKILTPAFHLHNLNEYMESIVDHTERMIKKLKTEATSDGVIKELLPLLSTHTLNIICESAMGITTKENDPDRENYKMAVQRIGEIIYYRSFRPWLMNNWIFGLTAKGREHAESLKVLHDFANKIIKDRKEYHEQTGGKYLNDFMITGGNTSSQSNGSTKRKRLAFLDLLIAASKQGLGIDDQGMREEVDTFVFAGHDTTAMSLLFTILLLAEHKDIQARARAEVDEILKESDGQITIDEIQRFTYLECCIKEAQRLYPSVPVISKTTQEDTQFKHCFVPKDTILLIYPIDTHRDPNFWPQPEIYNPDRFLLSEQLEKRHPFSFIPFSAGPRNCIGQKFAMLELKSLIAGLLYNFYFEPQDSAASVRIVPDLVIRPAHPVYVKFVPIIKKDDNFN